MPSRCTIVDSKAMRAQAAGKIEGNAGQGKRRTVRSISITGKQARAFLLGGTFGVGHIHCLAVFLTACCRLS
jgi:hypothetical protein